MSTIRQGYGLVREMQRKKEQEVDKLDHVEPTTHSARSPQSSQQVLTKRVFGEEVPLEAGQLVQVKVRQAVNPARVSLPAALASSLRAPRR